MESNTQNRPSYKVYQVLDLGEDKKSHWNQIGVAWAHKDGVMTESCVWDH